MTEANNHEIFVRIEVVTPADIEMVRGDRNDLGKPTRASPRLAAKNSWEPNAYRNAPIYRSGDKERRLVPESVILVDVYVVGMVELYLSGHVGSQRRDMLG